MHMRHTVRLVCSLKEARRFPFSSDKVRDGVVRRYVITLLSPTPSRRTRCIAQVYKQTLAMLGMHSLLSSIPTQRKPPCLLGREKTSPRLGPNLILSNSHLQRHTMPHTSFKARTTYANISLEA